MEIGDYIKFRYTGEDGIICEIGLDGTYMVRLSDGDIIPAFEEDFLLAKDFKQIEKTEYKNAKKKNAPAPTKQKTTAELFFSEEEIRSGLDKWDDDAPKIIENKKSQAGIFKRAEPENSGLHLVFIFSEKEDSYIVYWLNDTAYQISLQMQITLEGRTIHHFKHFIPAYDFFPVGSISTQELHLRPTVLLEAEALHIRKEWKLKIQQFWKSQRRVPIMNIDAVMYTFTEKINLAKEELPADLKAYTQRFLEESKKEHPELYKWNDLHEKANFPTKIDLHIETIYNQHEKLANHEKLALQLRCFEDYLERAIELGVSPIFIIHGIGKGVLKEKIHQYLYRHKSIKNYKNEYNELYGYGATEIEL